MRLQAVVPCILALALALGAGIATSKGDEPPEEEGAASGSSAGLGFGLRTLDPDGSGNDRQSFLYFNLPIEFRLGRLGVGLNADLNFDEEGRLRTEDWDERSDYARVVRYLEWGRKRDTVYVRSGELDDAMLGHATVLSHFHSGIDYDSRKVGAQVDVDLGIAGVETITNNVMEPEVAGGRFYVRPFHRSAMPLISSAGVGATLVGDVDAPETLEFQQGSPRPTVDRDGNLQAATNRDVAVYGVDVEVPVFKNEVMDLVPYADANRMDRFGDGYHTGVYDVLKLPGLGSDLFARLEWGKFGREYLPRYFDAFYEVERFRYPDKASPTTKLQAVPRVEPTEGWMGELRWARKGVFSLNGDYQDYDDEENGELGVRGELLAVKDVELSSTYRKRGIEDPTELFSVDENSILTASMAYAVAPRIYAGFLFTRTWRLDPRTGEYESLDVYTPLVFTRFDW
ncbi:MAG: hypothetical protein HY722_01050 [Planctomycetes bacterium]|nr:hypothetical protein [Planctomycetota bacterium]